LKVTACPKCGSRKIFQGRLKEGVLTGYTDKQVCRNCGYQGTALVFDNIEEYYKFSKEKKSEKKPKKGTKDKKSEEKIDLSEKEKEVIEFLKEIEGKTKKKRKKHKPEKEFNFMKNSLIVLSIVIFVTGIWIAARGGILTMYGISLLIVGVILFIAGLLSGKEKDVANQTSKPTFGGIFLMMAGVLGSFSWLEVTLFFDQRGIDSLVFERISTNIDIETVLLYIQVCLVIIIIFSILSVIGGLLAIKRKNWRLSVICGFFGLLSIGPFFSSTILAFAALVLIIKSKNEFEKIE
jgi:cation transport ATPase